MYHCQCLPELPVQLCPFTVLYLQVMNNHVKAEHLSQQADDIEEAAAKTLAEKSANIVMFQQDNIESVDASRDDTAVITVTLSLSNIGVIDSANTAALTMFGYTKRDLVGKNVNTLIPFPLSAAHNDYILKFIMTGKQV